MENRRQHRRYAAAVAAELEVDGEVLEAETRDISQGGVAVLLVDPLDEGMQLGLTLILTQDGIEDPEEEPFESAAKVMWAAPTESGEAMMGLRFVDPEEDQKARLQRFLAALAESPG